MKYISQFGMEYNPFIKNEKETKIELSEYKQLIHRLHHLEEIKGIGIITGEPGLGKTTTLRYWVKGLNTALYKIIYIPHTTITIMEFYRQLADEFGIEPSHSKRKNFKAIQEEITRLVIEKRITPVIILDEANYLPSAVLNDLKLLANFDMDSKDRLIILLVGQSVLRSTLNLKSNEALRQRISMNYSLQPMSWDETKKYINQKLEAAGLTFQLLTDDAYNQIINASKGIPRMVNQIMDKAFLLLENRKEREINGEIAMDAINEATIS